jgi:hypothetical protein
MIQLFRCEILIQCTLLIPHTPRRAVIKSNGSSDATLHGRRAGFAPTVDASRHFRPHVASPCAVPGRPEHRACMSPNSSNRTCAVGELSFTTPHCCAVHQSFASHGRNSRRGIRSHAARTHTLLRTTRNAPRPPITKSSCVHTLRPFRAHRRPRTRACARLRARPAHRPSAHVPVTLHACSYLVARVRVYAEHPAFTHHSPMATLINIAARSEHKQREGNTNGEELLQRMGSSAQAACKKRACVEGGDSQPVKISAAMAGYSRA